MNHRPLMVEFREAVLWLIVGVSAGWYVVKLANTAGDAVRLLQ